MSTQTVTDQPEIASTSEETRVITMESAVSAAFIASGIGSVVLGLTIIGAETNESFKTFLTFHAGAGPLSGKTTLMVIAFVLSWVVLHFIFRARPIKLATGFTISVILVVLGLLLTFPPVFLSFGG
jgi:cytosine/uracil/thiamine/allantoin permease